jgi:hypothetical protein
MSNSYGKERARSPPAANAHCTHLGRMKGFFAKGTRCETETSLLLTTVLRPTHFAISHQLTPSWNGSAIVSHAFLLLSLSLSSLFSLLSLSLGLSPLFQTSTFVVFLYFASLYYYYQASLFSLYLAVLCALTGQKERRGAAQSET